MSLSKMTANDETLKTHGKKTKKCGKIKRGKMHFIASFLLHKMIY